MQARRVETLLLGNYGYEIVGFPSNSSETFTTITKTIFQHQQFNLMKV